MSSVRKDRSYRILAALVTLLMLMTAAPAFAISTEVQATADTAVAIENRAEMAASPDGSQSPEPKGASLYPMSEERRDKLESYSRFVNIWRFAGFFAIVGVYLLILVTGLSARLRTWAGVARKRFFVVWLFWAMFCVVEYALYLPFSIYRGFVVESNYGFLNQGLGGWFGEDLIGLVLRILIGIIPVWFFYWLVGRMKRWWLAFTLGAIPIVIIGIVVAPVVIDPIFNDYVPLKDPQLRHEILSLASRAGIGDSDVFQVNASEQSSKINAYVTGLFGSKRIVLYDTMIDNFETDEIRFVMAHEMGHYVMHHIWWGLGVAIVFMLFALWLLDRTIRPVIRRWSRRFRFERLSDLASLPLVLIFVTVIMFVFQPATNYASRAMERQADRYGLEMSGVSTETAVRTFEKLSVFNLSDPDPHPAIEFWFYSHPSLQKRIETVRGEG